MPLSASCREASLVGNPMNRVYLVPLKRSGPGFVKPHTHQCALARPTTEQPPGKAPAAQPHPLLVAHEKTSSKFRQTLYKARVRKTDASSSHLRPLLHPSQDFTTAVCNDVRGTPIDSLGAHHVYWRSSYFNHRGSGVTSVLQTGNETMSAVTVLTYLGTSQCPGPGPSGPIPSGPGPTNSPRRRFVEFLGLQPTWHSYPSSGGDAQPLMTAGLSSSAQKAPSPRKPTGCTPNGWLVRIALGWRGSQGMSWSRGVSI